MSEDTFDSVGDDDAEMLAAIRAAFGDEAAEEEMEDDTSSFDKAGDQDLALEQLVREIDQKAVEGAKASQTSVPVKSTQEETSLKFIVVEMAGTVFGIPMENVYEIQRVPRVTFLPGVPDWVRGVTNLRGNIVSVVSLQSLLGLEQSDSTSNSQRLVVTQSLVDDVDSGLIVDRVVGIRNFQKSQIQKPTASVNDRIEPYLTGVVDSDQLVALLDIDKLLLSDEFRQFDAA